MALVNVYNKSVSRPNINIRFDELKAPLKNIEKAIIDSNDKLIESQKDKFIDLNGVSIRVSLIEAVTEIQDNKFCVVFSKNARTDNIEFEHKTSLGIRKLYNKVASEIGVKLSLPVCSCGETIEKADIKVDLPRYQLDDSFLYLCSDCRKRIMLEKRLYSIVDDFSTMNVKLKFLDGQVIELDLFQDKPPKGIL